LSTVTTGEEFGKFARNARVIVVDIDKVEHSKNTVQIDRLIISDAKQFILAILRENLYPANKWWLDKCRHWKDIFPKCEDKYRQSDLVDLYNLADCLSNVLQNSSVLIADSGLEELIIPSTVSFKKGQRCLHPASQGSMGYALPAAVGAYYAHGGEIIAVIGDGSIMMNLQELQTISYNKIPIKILVINNNVYSVIRSRQLELFRNRTIGTDPENGVSCPDFSKVANCFDIPYSMITDSSDLRNKLKQVFSCKGPVLCEIMAVRDQEYICNSFTHNLERKIVRRPIEDQAPFLDRELFLSEMVVDPIDQ